MGNAPIKSVTLHNKSATIDMISNVLVTGPSFSLAANGNTTPGSDTVTIIDGATNATSTVGSETSPMPWR